MTPQATISRVLPYVQIERLVTPHADGLLDL